MLPARPPYRPAGEGGPAIGVGIYYTDVVTGAKTPGKGCEMSSRDLQFVLNLCRSPDRRAREQDPKQPRPDILNRLHKLPESDQNLLNLAITGRHTFRQIANLVGSNPGSVCR